MYEAVSYEASSASEYLACMLFFLCVLILLYKSHTTIYMCSCSYVCVLMLLYMFPHATIYVSSGVAEAILVYKALSY